MTRPEQFTVYQATDAGTPPETLEQMAGARPDLRQFVAGNPSTSPEVLAWLSTLEDPAVTAALMRRANSATTWATPAHGGPPPPTQPPVGQPYGQPVAPYDTPPAGGYGTPAPNPYAAPTGNAYAPPTGNPYAADPYAAPAGNPYAQGPAAGEGQQAGYVPSSSELQASGGYGYQAAGYQPPGSGNRTGLIVAIVVGAVLLVGALIFAATSIFSSLETTDFGDDADLDLLWDECAAGDPAACDDLYRYSPLGSEYEEFGDTCGDRQPVGTQRWCVDVM